ncbi:hypothetical protein CES85_3722 (plasmid) [Ochrobactrum quorumnocens]|uniref:Uncharacterized protein n=1 Tax=Ochrobactrum quorumnocens TaxID=271865 RepID=A0A248UPM3_9HYPH|nr:hypothetical protein CES85_3722 [[Ochrobactrum] quorumnocens]
MCHYFHGEFCKNPLLSAVSENSSKRIAKQRVRNRFMGFGAQMRFPV